MGQYGWNMVHGLVRTERFRAITVLAGGGVSERQNGHTESGGTLTTRHVWNRDDPRAALRLRHAIRAERPDVVWFNLGFAVFGMSRVANFLGLALPMLTRRAGLPTVVTLHELFEAVRPTTLGMSNGRLTALGAHAATRLLLQSDVVCVTLGRYVQALRALYGAHNVRHVPHGAFSSPEFLRHPPGAPPCDILILATYAPFKGLRTLLEAFARVRQLHPEVTLTIAGADHPRFPGYLASVRASVNGTPGIRWLGAQPEAQLREVFASARVVVLPYTATTGASSVLHRAAGCGRPVVVSDLPDLRAVVEEEGLQADFAPPGDAGGLAVALSRLLSDPARQHHLAHHNLARMRTMTLDHTCAQYVEVFEQVAGRGV
jgi:glycosyltransferase involved in cell wall biosynthesis